MCVRYYSYKAKEKDEPVVNTVEYTLRFVYNTRVATILQVHIRVGACIIPLQFGKDVALPILELDRVSRIIFHSAGVRRSIVGRFTFRKISTKRGQSGSRAGPSFYTDVNVLSVGICAILGRCQNVQSYHAGTWYPRLIRLINNARYTDIKKLLRALVDHQQYIEYDP